MTVKVGGSRHQYLSGSIRGKPILVANSGAIGVLSTTPIHAPPGGTTEAGNQQDYVYIEAHNNSATETVDLVLVTYPENSGASARTSASIVHRLKPGETKILLDNVNFQGDPTGNALGIEAHVIDSNHVDLVQIYGGFIRIDQSGQ